VDTYTLNESEGSFACHLCGKISVNPSDYQDLYCTGCHFYHEDVIHGGENQSLWTTQY